MNRLRKQIKELKAQLEEQKMQKSNANVHIFNYMLNLIFIKISYFPFKQDHSQLFDKILQLEGSFVHHQATYLVNEKEVNRRRTWMCPRSDISELKVPSLAFKTPSFAMDAPPPFILRPHGSSHDGTANSYDPFSDEVFNSPSKVNFDRTLSPMKGARNTEDLKNMIHTPRALKPLALYQATENSPLIGTVSTDPYVRIAELEQELEELKDFKLVEEYISTKGDDLNELQQKLTAAKDALLEQESKNSELQKVVDQKNVEIENLRESETKKVLAEMELKKVVQKWKDLENDLSSTQYEFDLVKEKAKTREAELIASLKEAREESKVDELNEKIKSLQEILKKTEAELFTFQSNANVAKQSVSEDTKVHTDRIKELENQMQLLKEESKQKIVDLKKENATLSDQVMEALQDTDNLQQKIEKLESESSLKESQLKELIADQLKLSEEMMDNISESEKLQKEVTKLQSEIDAHVQENKKLQIKLDESVQKISIYERIHEKLINGNFEEIEEDDDFGKLIHKMHLNSSKTETLEIEKLQLMKDLDDIRKIVEDLSEKLVAMQSVADGEQQLKVQVEVLVDELTKTKALLEDSVKKSNDCDAIIDDLKRQLSENQRVSSDNAELEKTKALLEEQIKKGTTFDTTIDDLRQQLEKLSRENAHMAATLKDCETFEIEVEKLTKEKDEMQATIADLLSKVPIKAEVQDRSVDIFGDSFNLSARDENFDYSAQIESLNLEISELKSNMESDRLQIGSLREEKLSLTERVTECEAQMAEKALENDILTKKLEIIQNAQANEEESLIDELQAQLSLREEQISQLETKLEEFKKLLENSDQLSESNDILQRELSDLTSKLTLLEEEKSNAQELLAKLESYESENERLVASLTEYMSRESTYEKHEKESMEKDCKIMEMQEKIDSLEDLLQKTAQNSTDDEKSRLEGELIELKSQNQSLIDQYSTSKAISDELNARLTTAEANLREKLADVSMLETQVVDLSKDLSSLKEQFDESSNKVRELESIIGDLKQQLDENQVPSDYQENILQIEILQKQIERLTAENSKIAELESTTERLLSEKSDVEANYEKLLSDKQSKDAENELLKQNIKGLEDQSNELNDKVFTMNAEMTNRDSMLIIKDEKIAQLESDVKRAETEFEEAKTRLRRRSFDSRSKTDALEAKINDLMKQLGETEAFKLGTENELKRLKVEFSKACEERDQLKVASDENDVKFAVLDEKYSQLSESKLKLESELKSLKLSVDQYKKEIESLNAQVSQHMSENFTHSKTVGELREKCEFLTQQLEDKKKLSVSPRPRRSNEIEAETVFNLQHKQLVAETNSGTPVRAQRSNQERKTRRQSVYDDNRRLSAWERFQSIETQTEAVSNLCACAELAEKLKKVTIDLKIRDCKIANFERMANAHPLKIDLKQAQTDLDKERRAHAKCQESLDAANRKIMELAKNQKGKTEHVTRSVQVGKSMSNYIEKVKLILNLY